MWTGVLAAAALSVWLLTGVVGSGSHPARGDPQLPSVRRGGARLATDTTERPLVLHSTRRDAFVTPSGLALQLRGLNMIPVWRDQPGRTWTQSHYDQIASRGFNALRFVLYWDLFEPRRGGFSQTALRTLDTAIARAKAAGLYVILDEIHLWGPRGVNYVPRWAQTGDTVSTIRANGGGYVKMLARRYRPDPAVAGYDLVSEFYRQPIDQNAVLRTYDHLISQVRRADRRKIVVIEPSYGDSSVAGALADFGNLTRRTNVVWSIHDFFAGGDRTGYRADGAQVGRYTWNGRTGYRHPDRRELENHLLVQLGTVQREGLPMWIGEFGIGAHTAHHDKWIAQQVALFRKYRLGWAWWGYGTGGEWDPTGASDGWQPWARLLVPAGR